MLQENKIGHIEAIFLIVSIMINHIIFNLIKSVTDLSGSSTLLNILFVFIIVLGIVYLICKINDNFPNQDILDISEFLGGKVLKNIIGFLFIIYFLLSASIFIRDFSESIKIIFFQNVSISLIIILFIIGIILCNRLGANAIIRANVLFVPLLIFSILFIFFANIEDFSILRIFPLLGNGSIPTFVYGLSNIFTFSGIALLYFIPPSLKDSKQYKKIAFSSITISLICLIFSTATLVCIFPFIATRNDEILPLYLASRFIEFGRFFGRLDAIFLLVWIISMMFYLSIVISFVNNIFKKLTNFQHNYIIIYISSIILFLVSLLPRNYAQINFLETTVYKYTVLGIVFVISLIILIIANFKIKRKTSLKGE